MRRFGRFLVAKICAIIVVVVGSWIPWIVNLFAKDSFKQSVKALAGRSEVSSGVYQLLGMPPQIPSRPV
jgi:hypothetical protein